MRWIYVIGMLAIVGAWLVWTRRRKNRLVLVAGLSILPMTGLILASALGQGFFGGLRHLTDLVFIVLPVVLGLGSFRIEPKRHRWIGWTGALLLAGVGIWSTQIEPRWLEVTRHLIESPKVREPVRIVVVADFQTDHWTAYEDRVVQAIVDQKPDLLLFTGDYFQVESSRRQELADAFRRSVRDAGLAARWGAFAVAGDVDPPGWAEIFEGLPVTTFSKTTPFEAAGLSLTALSPEDSRPRRDKRRALIEPTESFQIAFGHAPDFALREPPADLMLAGHTHGGQVRLPFVGPLLTLSAVPRSWAAGRTDFADGRTLIVSRGLGMERGQAPRLRFLCRPELVVIDLVPAGGS